MSTDSAGLAAQIVAQQQLRRLSALEEEQRRAAARELEEVCGLAGGRDDCGLLVWGRAIDDVLCHSARVTCVVTTINNVKATPYC